MNAYTVAVELLGGIELNAMQLAKLRAIDHEHQQRLFDLLGAGSYPGARGGAREPTTGELAELRAMLEDGIRGMLSPDQRTLLKG